MVVSVPAAPNRYYVLQWFDHYTYNFAYVGARAPARTQATICLSDPAGMATRPGHKTDHPVGNARHPDTHGLVRSRGVRHLVAKMGDLDRIIEGGRAGARRRGDGLIKALPPRSSFAA
jgi:hypothetical protein